MATTSRKQALASFSGFLTSGDYSDLTITCGDDTYKVHKVIVCGRADFFARAIKFGGQRRRSRKQVRSICQMMNPAVIELLMQYLYEGEYAPMLPTDDADKTPGTTLTPQTTLTPRSKRGGKAATYTYEFPHTCCSYQNYCDYPQVCAHHTCESHCSYVCKAFNCNECNPPLLPKLDGTAEQLLVHAKLYELGDKYDVVGLKDIAKEKFDRACKHFWNTPTFAAAAHHAFSTTVEEDKGLRDIVSATISERIELVNDPGVSVLLTQFNGLALSILQAKIKELGWDKKS